MSGIFDQVLSYNPTILSSSLAGSVTYKGTWDAATNSPTLANPPAATTKGWYYVVSVAGTQFSLDFAVGDWIISNGSVWQKVDLTDSVSSVFGRTGPVAAQTGDYTAAQISGLGSLATQNGTFSGTSSGTNTGDQTISITGDATASGSTGVLTATVTKINGTSLAGLATGILKNTTTTGVPSIAVAADFPTLNQNTTGTASNVTGTVALANGGTGATNAPDARTALGLGSLATQNGTFSGTSSGTNTGDQTISITGDVTASGSTGALTATVGKINGVALIGLGTGILKNSTVTGQPGIAVAADFPTLNQNTSGTASNVTGVVAVSNGGTGASSLTGYVKGSGTAALTANGTIPNTDVSGLGTMSTQNASSVAITGGSINNTPIGAAVANSGAFTTVTASTPIGTASGGTGVNTTPSNGQVLIGNGTGYTANTLTAGSGISITNTAGGISIEATGGTATEIVTATVTNAESTTITKGQVVYAFGATGNRMSVKLAYNTLDATSAKTIGVVSDASIAANGTGTITLFGEVTGLALGSYADGDTLYLGATPGSVTSTKPYAPNHLVYVGIVERANNGNGELYVKIQNGYELDEIHDVQITSAPASGALLVRDATNSLWKAARLTAGTNIAITNADASVTVGITGIIGSSNGGTGNGFTKFSGPASSEKTFTLPNASSTLLYEGGSIGATTANTGAFTTLSASGTVTLSSSGALITAGTTTGYGAFQNSSGRSGIIAYGQTHGTYPDQLELFAANVAIARITSTGIAVTGQLTTTTNLGVGTTSPTDTNGFGRVLDIRSATGGQVVIRDNDDTTKFARLAFDGGTTNVAYVGAEGSGTSVLLRANNSTVATVSSTGLAVTGALSASGSTLTLGTNSGSGTSRRVFDIEAGGYAAPGAFNTDSNGDKINFFKGGSGLSYDARIGVGTTNNLWYRSSGGTSGAGVHEFYVGSTPTLIQTISSTGLAVTGAGKFGATSGSEMLVQSFTSGGGYGAIYSNSITPGANNYALISNGVNTYLNAPTLLGFNVNSDTRMSINASGNVGIGTTSPDHPLNTSRPLATVWRPDIRVGGYLGTQKGFIGSNNSDSRIKLSGGAEQTDSDGGSNWATAYGTTGAFVDIGEFGATRFFNNAGLTANATYTPTERARIDSSGNLLVGGTSNALSARALLENGSGNQLGLRYTGVATYYNSVDSSGNLIWTKDGTERARITSAGLFNVGIGSAGAGIINSNFNGSTQDGIDLIDTVDASTAGFIVFRNSAGTAIGSIQRVTTTNAVVYNTTSDGRLKENLRDFTDSGRLIDSLKPRVFDWKNSDENGKNVVGFVAQEEHAADPIFAHIGAVSVGDEDAETITKQWQRSDMALIPILVAELKNVRQRLAALETK